MHALPVGRALAEGEWNASDWSSQHPFGGPLHLFVCGCAVQGEDDRGTVVGVVFAVVNLSGPQVPGRALRGSLTTVAGP
jgi:hypothetical protein